jgi:hydrogenase maturation protease
VILIMGYGNGLRSDDAIGRMLARLLGQRLNQEDDLRVYQLHQLTPELIERIAGASFVIFIDAREGGQPGTVMSESVSPQVNDAAFTHHISPAELLGAALDWYGAAPQGLLISVVGASFEYGDRLSPEMTDILPTILDEVDQLIRSHIFAEESDHA